MDKQEAALLRYRRQYILSPEKIDCPFSNRSFEIGNSLFLYAHTELEISIKKEGPNSYILLGNLFDAEHPSYGNEQILNDLIHKDFNQLLVNISAYAGNFVFLFHDGLQTKLAHDATANKKVYYCSHKGKSWCASQAHLLARVCGISPSEESSRLAYYNSGNCHALDNASVSHTTAYDEISQLLPNHYLNLDSLTSDRYWPIRHRKPISVAECAERCTFMLKGYFNSISNRYKVMMPITAGKDSRTMLAVSREHREKVFYYLNRTSSMDINNKDIQIPTELFKKLDLEYHVLNPEIEVDEEFERIYFENNPMASPSILPTIYNYYLNFPDRVNMPGNVATGATWWWPTWNKKHDTDMFLRINNLTQFSHAREAYAQWRDQAKEYAEKSGFSIFDLFYWEERLGNWGTQYLQDKEMAQAEFNLFNSRMLVETMMSVKPVYAIEYEPYLLNKAIIRKLWPEVLQLPINPSNMNRRTMFFHRIGMGRTLYWLWATGRLKKF